MRQIAAAVVLVLLSAGVVNAQALPTSQLAWDQPNTTAAEAQGYTFRYYPDGSEAGVVLTGVTCGAGPVVVCSVQFPAFTPGAHTLQLTASNAAGESVKSAPFAFTFVVVPSAPTNLRIQ